MEAVAKLVEGIPLVEREISSLEARIAAERLHLAELRARLVTATAELQAELADDPASEPAEESWCLLDDTGDWWASEDGETWGVASFVGRNVWGTGDYTVGSTLATLLKAYEVQS